MNGSGKHFCFNTKIILIVAIISSCGKKYHTQDLQYHSTEITISARIYQPPGEGKFPAVVLVPSAEPDTKEVYEEYAKYFASHGIVALCYDKRGAGSSTGDIRKADFYDLFDDAYAGLQQLKKLDDVDTSKMGFLGHSQGGMYIFMADSVANDVAFVIDVAGSPGTPLRQSHYNISSKIRENGGSSAYADSLAYLMDDYINYLASRQNYFSIKRRYDLAIADKEKPIADKINYFDQFNYLLPPEKLPPFDSLNMYPFMRSCNFEPGKFYPSLTIPALVVYGRKDHVIPSDTCIAKVKQLQQLNNGIDLEVYENANHAMKEEGISGQHYPDDYLNYLTQWIKSH